jgi:hypothetical protein
MLDYTLQYLDFHLHSAPRSHVIPGKPGVIRRLRCIENEILETLFCSSNREGSRERRARIRTPIEALRPIVELSAFVITPCSLAKMPVLRGEEKRLRLITSVIFCASGSCGSASFSRAARSCRFPFAERSLEIIGAQEGAQGARRRDSRANARKPLQQGHRCGRAP